MKIILSNSKVIAYHVGNGFDDGFDLAKSGTGEGNRVLGPGIYFATKSETALMYKQYAKVNPTVYTVEIDTANIHNFSVWEMTDAQLGRWNALARELGFASFGDIPNARNAMKNGWNQVGGVVEAVGDANARKMFIKHGITGAMERIGNGVQYEICVYDPRIIKIIGRVLI